MPINAVPPVLLIIGPSGSGKSSLVQNLQRENVLTLVPTWTDRPPRPEETDGEHVFVTPERLDAAHAAGTFMHEPVALFGLSYRYALPYIVGYPYKPVPCIMVRAAVMPLVDMYIPRRIVYQVEAPKERVIRVLESRAAQGDDLGSRLSNYDAEISSGREWADRIFTNDDLGRLTSEVREAIEADFHTGVISP